MPDTQILDPLPNLPCVNLPLVHEYVDGTLDPATHRRVAAHLAGCEVCDSERAFVVELRAQVADMPRLAPPDHLWDAIAASLGEGAGHGEDDDSDGEADTLPQWGTGTFGPDIEPPVRAIRRAPLWRGWVAGMSISAAAVAVMAPSMISRLQHAPVVAARPANSSLTDVSASQTPAPSSQTASREAADAQARPSDPTTLAAASSVAPRVHRGSVPVQQVASTASGESMGNPLLSTDGAGFDGMVLSGVSLDRSSGSRQVQQAELASEREKLFQAEAAIASCEAALRDNPNDPRISLEYKRALETKAHALEVIKAASRSTLSPGTPEGYPVSLEPSGSPREYRW